MAQLRLGYPEIQRRGAAVLQITPAPPSVGSLYAKRFKLPFPYLCDENLVLHHRYGLVGRGTKAAAFRVLVESLPGSLAGMIKGAQPPLAPYKGLDPSTDQGIYLLGQDGRVRFRQVIGVHAHIPSNDALLRALDSAP